MKDGEIKSIMAIQNILIEKGFGRCYNSNGYNNKTNDDERIKGTIQGGPSTPDLHTHIRQTSHPTEVKWNELYDGSWRSWINTKNWKDRDERLFPPLIRIRDVANLLIEKGLPAKIARHIVVALGQSQMYSHNEATTWKSPYTGRIWVATRPGYALPSEFKKEVTFLFNQLLLLPYNVVNGKSEDIEMSAFFYKKLSIKEIEEKVHSLELIAKYSEETHEK